MTTRSGDMRGAFLDSKTTQRVIDVDAHFEPGHDWLLPYPDLARRLPPLDPGMLAVDAIVGDLLRGVPREDWPPMQELLPPGLATLYGQEKAGEQARRAEFEGRHQFQVANAEARLAWMDAQGIDLQHVICLAGIAYGLQLTDPALRREAVQCANSWLADTCAAGRGRLLPVTALDYEDLDWAVAELGRMRRLGSRIVLIPAYPVNGIPPIHPRWDVVWEAIVANGMVAMLHTGFERMRFDPGWANLGGDVTLMRMLGSGQRQVAPNTLLNGLCYTGVFERFPQLTVLLAEVGTGWLPFLYREIDDRTSPTAELFLGSYRLPMKPSEYLARNVKATPLSGGNDTPLARIMEDLPPEMLVFSSDFPHFEGFSEPAGYFSTALKGLSANEREAFAGGTIERVFAGMGQPL
jgi:predicted TIM-barrel fold metal-dependent hydrolase